MPALLNTGAECVEKTATPLVGAEVHACDSNATRECVATPNRNTERRNRFFIVFFLIFVLLFFLIFAMGAHGQQPQQETTTAVTSNDSSPSQEPARRALPAPLDGIFPGSDYLGPTPLIGVPDTDPVYPLTNLLWSSAPPLKGEPESSFTGGLTGISVSTSNKSNIPESYAIVPNRLELDQGVLRVERLPDTVQTDHVDWGFRLKTMESTTAGLLPKGGSAGSF